jgi:hypothetical protein
VDQGPREGTEWTGPEGSVPDAEAGYTPGYGGVYDATVTPANRQSAHTRVIIVVAVKKGLAIRGIQERSRLPGRGGKEHDYW